MDNGKVRRLIVALGGQKAVAEAIGKTPITTVNSWMMRDNIPDWRIGKVYTLAVKKKIAMPLWLKKQHQNLL